MSVVISLGGSLIAPETINVDYLKQLKEFFLNRQEKFILICGGGHTARKYQQAVSAVIGDDSETLDWMGISTTYVNAFFMRCILGSEHIEEHIVSDPHATFSWDKKILLASGWKPGRSTDYDAIVLADRFNVDTVINMSNVTHVYDKDPRKHDDAKKFENMSWDELLDIIGEDWSPGLHAPFDPIAAKEAKEKGKKVLIMGPDIKNLEQALDNKKFAGTTVH